MRKIDRDFSRWVSPQHKPKIYTPVNPTELQTLIKCDESLEAIQDYMRGDTKVLPIRKLIAKRIKALQEPK